MGKIWRAKLARWRERVKNEKILWVDLKARFVKFLVNFIEDMFHTFEEEILNEESFCFENLF